MPVKKSTKKFLKNRLKGELKRRKEHQKVKSQFNKKKKSDNEDGDEDNNNINNEKHINSYKNKNMNGHNNYESQESDVAFSSEGDDDDDDELLDSFQGTGHENDDLSEMNSEEEEDGDDNYDDDEEESENEDEDVNQVDLANETPKERKERLKRQVEEHKKQLLEMKEKDPEFFKYLQENDSNLLNFGESDDDKTESDDDDEAEQMDAENEEEMEEDVVLVTKEMVQNWKSLIVEKNSMSAVKQLVKAFKAAVLAGETESEQTVTQDYLIEDRAIVNLVVISVLKYVPQAFYSFLNYDPITNIKRLPSSSNKWKRARRIIKVLVTHSIKLMKQVTDPSIVAFTMKEISKALPLFVCFSKLCRQLTKYCISVWCSSMDEKVRVQAFLNLRKLASDHAITYLDMILKSCYLSFQRNCKEVTTHSMPSIHFMTNCLVELYGLKSSNSYHFAFIYIRQLAVLLRNAIVTKTKESFKKVYNWQFLLCSRVWVDVLCGYCDLQTGVESSQLMKQLIYPLVQIMLGVMGLKPSSKYFPYRFHCIRILLDITRRTGTFIPLGSFLFDVLSSSDIASKAKPSTMKQIDMGMSIKLPNNYIKTKPCQNQLIEETIHLMFEFYSSFALHIGFPELVIPGILSLKKSMKQLKNPQFSKTASPLLDKLQENAKFIEQKRTTVEFSPKDLEQALHFLDHIDPCESPLYKYCATKNKFKLLQQQQRQEEQESVMNSTESKSKEIKKKKNNKKNESKDTVMMREAESGSDEEEEDLVEDFEEFFSDEE